MVHALHRADALLARNGCVVDLRPTSRTARVEIDGVPIGLLDADAADRRHAAAEAALAAVLTERLFREDAADEFWFLTHGGSIEELRDHVHATWRDSRINAPLIARVHAEQRVNAGRVLCVAEQLRITRLLPG
jgi:hypothetical protein